MKKSNSQIESEIEQLLKEIDRNREALDEVIYGGGACNVSENEKVPIIIRNRISAHDEKPVFKIEIKYLLKMLYTRSEDLKKQLLELENERLNQ